MHHGIHRVPSTSQPSDLSIYHPTPLALTSSGGHRNMYGWQAGGTYPTGMLSWFDIHSRDSEFPICDNHPLIIENQLEVSTGIIT